MIQSSPHVAPHHASRLRYAVFAGAVASLGIALLVFLSGGPQAAGVLSALVALILATLGVTLLVWARFTRLEAEHYLLGQVVANYPNGVILLYDSDVRFHFLEGQGAHDLGFTRDKIVGRTMADIFPPEVWDPISHNYTGVFQGRNATFELRFRDLVRQAHTMPVRDKRGRIVAGMVVTYDITRQKQVEQALRMQEERLLHLALHDPLTNLANRALFNNQLEQALARARRSSSGVAVLFLDLDNFKPVNDTLGHEAGDQLLIEVGKRLSSTVRGGDTVARFGGDEFVILLEDVGSEHDASNAALQIMQAIDAPFEVSGQTLTINASLGYSLSLNGDHSEAGELIRKADVAMYQAKTSGKHRYLGIDSATGEQLSLLLN